MRPDEPTPETGEPTPGAPDGSTADDDPDEDAEGDRSRKKPRDDRSAVDPFEVAIEVDTSSRGCWLSGWDRGGRRRRGGRTKDGGPRRADRRDRGGSGDSCGFCDICDSSCNPCDSPCDLFLITRLSTLLLVAAAVLPETGGAAVVRAALRLYRRRLTRFTRPCPSTPSCSAFAWDAVESLGVRRGLTAAAHRVRTCGSRPAHCRPGQQPA